MAHPPDDRPEEEVFSNDDKYIIKWFERLTVGRVLDLTISKDIGLSI